MPKEPELDNYDDYDDEESEKGKSNKVPTELVDNIINETTKRRDDDELIDE